MRQRSFLFAVVFIARSAEAQVPSTQGTANGKQLFAANCSVGYCHGAEGRAGRGPRLKDRQWDRSYLFQVIDEGIPKSSMPAWRGKLSSEQIWSIVAYILSISKEIAASDATATVHPGLSIRQPDVSHPAESRNDPANAGIMGNSGNGKALFFDATNERNCSVCHKAGDTGGDVGPDLGKITGLPAREILTRILLFRNVSNRKPAMEVVTRGGETLRGVLADENALDLRLYDLTSPGPPVLRSVSLADIVQRRPVELNVAHENFAETYTLKQLLDIVTFLKSGQESATVRLDDLF